MSYPVPLVSRCISRRLLAGVATLAIGGSVLPQPAVAQSFQGTPTVTVGGATVDISPNNTLVNVNAPITVINWRPDDTTGTDPILFQPAGTTALFRSINFQDFTVLNRILPVDVNGAPLITRPIRFDGTVNSQFGISAAGAAGSIWFYTPGGIILGSSSAFNVGSLVLSTSDINQANIFVGNNGTINFTGTPNTGSAITLENGAQVSALINGSSYVALVAPRVVQNGTIQVDGSAALVGGEAVDITMNGPGGLFDITVSTGTDDANGVVHGELGTTTGPASAGAGDAQRIYMMAIPKNTAINMLVNGNVGYAPAASASVQNGQVVLSAGYNIADGAPDFGEHAAPVSNVQANLTIGETSQLFTSFSSLTLARASGDLLASPGSNSGDPSALTFASSAFLVGDLSAIVEASNGDETVTVEGDLFVVSRRNGQGGNAAVRAMGGLVGVGGGLSVDASSLGFSGTASGISLSNPNGGDGRGGNASINVVDGNLRVAGTTRVSANGAGGFGVVAMGNGFGGNASVSLSGAGATAILTGGLDVEGSGFGVLAYLESLEASVDAPETVNGGNGTGGSASVSIDNIDLLTLPNLTIASLGIGDAGGGALVSGGIGGGNGGTGTGGSATFSLNNEALELPDLVVNASGIGGDGGGGSDSSTDAAGNGGAGTGGNATIRLTNAASFSLTIDLAGSLAAIATGTGGDGGNGAGTGGLGGDGTGGGAVLSADGSGSIITISELLVQANGLGGNGGISGVGAGADGGNAQGGNALVTISNAATGDLGATAVEALAQGGFGSDGQAGLPGGNGGNAIGGDAALAVVAASATSIGLAVQGDGRGGAAGINGTGGAGTGGAAGVTVTTGNYSAALATITANGRGDISTGGSATISAIGGTLGFSTTVASADGETGSQAGGLVSVLADTDALGTSGSMNLGLATLSSDAFSGVAGTVRITNNNGDPAGGAILFSQLSASADGLVSTNPAAGVFVRANQSDILVTGDANLLARDVIGIGSVGQGTFAAGGNMSATAGGDIIITHDAQPGMVDTVRGTIISFLAYRNLDAQTGSIVRGTNFVDALAVDGFAYVDGLYAPNSSTVAAGSDATIGTAAITSGSLNLFAGTIMDTSSWQRATATIQGNVTTSDALLVNSGGDIVTNGATIATGNSVTFNAGDDIIIRNSAISSAQNVTSSGEIALHAGAITPVDALPGEIRSLVIANSALTSPGFDLALTADAIDATSAVINANRLIALVSNPPAPGVAGGNDAGLLAANCVQGTICLGPASTSTQILVGPATGTIGLANRVTIAGSLASGNISIRARDGVTFTGPITVAADNMLFVSALNGPIDLTGVIGLRGFSGLNLYAGSGAISGPNTSLNSNGNIGLFAAGGIALGSLDTLGVMNTIDDTGNITTAGSLLTPGNVSITGQLAVRGGAASINSGGAITIGNVLTPANVDVLLTSTGAQSLGAIVAGRDVTINAASLDVASVNAPRNLNATVSGNASFGNLVVNQVTVRAGQNATFNGLVSAATAIDVGANGQAVFNGLADAANITVRSGDIALGAAARLGTAGNTQNVVLTNSAGSQMAVGGANGAAAYSLSDLEIARIFGDNIDISWTNNLASTGLPVIPPAGGFTQPSVVVGAFTLSSRAGNAAGNLAANGTLSIRTAGSMQVNGAVVLNGAGAGNIVRLNADQSLQILAGQGSIGLRGNGNSLAGTLILNAANIIAGSPSAIANIAGLTDPVAINARLGFNDGFASDTGVLSAGTVDLNGGNAVFIQNSGSTSLFRDRRGVTANAINVSLTNPNGLIVINGQIASANFATGLDTIPLLGINGLPSQTAAGFDPLSTMNGCQITAIASCRQRETPVSITDDDISQPLDPDQSGSNQFPTALIEVKEFETYGYPPLIDEPVTGSGNDDLWPATCNPFEETCPLPLIPTPQ